MVALTIATIVIVGAGIAQTVCYDLTRTSEETNTAVSDLRIAMEQILLLVPEDIPDAAGPYAPGQPIAQFEGLHLEDERIVATYPTYSGVAVPDPLEIVLTITWSDFAGRSRTISMATITTR